MKAQLRSCESDHSVVAYVNCFKENEELLKKVKSLENDLAKFTQSSENLNQILSSQKPLFDKAGLGFYKSDRKPSFKDKASSSNDTRFQDPTYFNKTATPRFCRLCNRSDHFLFSVSLVCLASKRKENMWYMDSGCSRHMTGKTTFFIKLDEYDGGLVTF
ncbi:hypothetical protein S245_010134, partial [Arachis hypogaea]